jgi:hypothetical protein
LREATNAFLTTLDRYTLADLMEPRQALSKLLQINVVDAPANPASAPA